MNIGGWVFFWSLRVSQVVMKRLNLKGHPKSVNKGQMELQERWSADLIADASSVTLKLCCAVFS